MARRSWKFALLLLISGSGLMSAGLQSGSAMCGGNPFITCPPAKKAAPVPAARRKLRNDRATSRRTR